jgi:hypothetical protein
MLPSFPDIENFPRFQEVKVYPWNRTFKITRHFISLILHQEKDIMSSAKKYILHLFFKFVTIQDKSTGLDVLKWILREAKNLFSYVHKTIFSFSKPVQRQLRETSYLVTSGYCILF